MLRNHSWTDDSAFVSGPGLWPASLLRAWLAGQADRRSSRRLRIRLPVVVRFTDEHRIALAGACVGTSAAIPGADALPLALDDSALGISLVDRLRSLQPEPGPAVALWLEGYSGRLLEVPSTVPADPWPFAVLAVGPTVSPDARDEDATAFVEASPV